MIAIGRHINGITINALEWVLDDDCKLRLFESEESARAFLAEHGVTEKAMYWMVFEEVMEGEE